MKYAIIAAGDGSRLAAEGVAEPKPLVRVGGRPLIDRLLDAGAEVVAYDPVAMDESRRMLAGKPVRYARNMYEAAEGADAVVLVTEWKEFRMPDWRSVKRAMYWPQDSATAESANRSCSEKENFRSSAEAIKASAIFLSPAKLRTAAPGIPKMNQTLSERTTRG